MEHQQYVLPSKITLHYVYQSQFTVHDFGVIHRYPYHREEMTALAMMKRMMTNVNAVHPTLSSMASFMSDQYELDYVVSQLLESSRLITALYASSIQGALLNDPSMDQAMIYHVLDSVYRPWFTHPDFLALDTVFDEEKTNNLYRYDQIKALIAEKIFQALKTLIPSDSPYIQELRGQEAELKTLEKSALKDIYSKWIQYPMDFYYVGPLPMEKVIEIVSSYPYIIAPTQEVKMIHTPILHDTFQSLTVQGEETQSHYRKIFTTEAKRLEKEAYALQLFTQILGVGSESLLFQDLREKNQFCYDVRASYDTNDSTITVRLALHKDNVPKTIEIIDKHIAMMQAGALTDELFNLHKQQMIDQLERNKDGEGAKISALTVTLMLSTPYDLNRSIRMYQSLTKEDIQQAALKVKPYRELIYVGVEI
jgi:predicted Zn-dependent peptidase